MTCDTSRVAITLTKQRLMTSSFDYYSLRYPFEGLKGGFSYKQVPHLKLSVIGRCVEIDGIYSKHQPAILKAFSKMTSTLTAVAKNAPTGTGKLNEWNIPFNFPVEWPVEVKSDFNELWKAKLALEAEIDSCVSHRSELDALYDVPEIDPTKLRITGPFSVEAVPNPIVRSLAEPNASSNADVAIVRSGETSRQATWRDELLRTGIRGKGGQMLNLTELETIPGLKHVHASGTFKESGERVLVSFGPEHAALEQRQVELALSEAETLRPAPKFIVFCAFTFDPEAAKDIDEVKWPGVTLLKAQMNTDLLTEDLKKARSSNQSFWLMGQPDVDVRKLKNGKWEVEVNGFDYFDTKAGELVSGGKNKIAMWSLDTDYDERSLFPHQVFFPMAGAKDGWQRLKKNIKAELNVDLLEQFHGTLSLPFDAGENKRVAIKIVDDRGIESLKIVALDD